MSLKKILASVAVASFAIGMIGCANNPATVSENGKQQMDPVALYTAANTARDISCGSNGVWPRILGITPVYGSTYQVNYWDNPSYSFKPLAGITSYRSIELSAISGKTTIYTAGTNGTISRDGNQVFGPTGATEVGVYSDNWWGYIANGDVYTTLDNGATSNPVFVKSYTSYSSSGKPGAARITGYDAGVYFTDVNGGVWRNGWGSLDRDLVKVNISKIARDISSSPDGKHLVITDDVGKVYLCKSTDNTNYTLVQQNTFSNVLRVSMDRVDFSSGIWVVTKDLRVVNAAASGW